LNPASHTLTLVLILEPFFWAGFREYFSFWTGPTSTEGQTGRIVECRDAGEGGGGGKKPAWFARASWQGQHSKMPSFLTRLAKRDFDDVPKPNAKRAASGEIVPIASGSSQPNKQGRRGQIRGALYSTALPDWDWTKWNKWLYPRKDGDAREHGASVESSVQQGYYTKLLVGYPSGAAKAEKQHRAHIRRASKLLVETNRNVRGSDGGSGKMAGGGDHFAYSGLVEVRQGTIPHTT